MSCFDCRYYTGEDYLACGVDPVTAASSPEEGCRDWQPVDDNYRPVDLEVTGAEYHPPQAWLERNQPEPERFWHKPAFWLIFYAFIFFVPLGLSQWNTKNEPSRPCEVRLNK